MKENQHIEYKESWRVETYPVPEEALREAVLNAVAHKDYSSGTPIQISVYDDKILFWNNGELYPGWTVETLTQKHSSQPFNPDVANAFFRAGMIEAFSYEHTGLWVTFPFQTEPKAKRIGVTAQETTQDRILTLLKAQPSITRKQLAEKIGISDDWEVLK